MEIKQLSMVEFDCLYKAFYLAFADYEVQLNEIQLHSMLQRRGFNPDLSFAAFDNNEIIAFTLNGIGNFNGIPTAYDAGTGTLKEYRGKGLATKIFGYSLPYLKKMNIRQCLLEVLQHNTKAISVYKNLGFEITREFNYFMQKNDNINNKAQNLDSHYKIRQIEFEEIDLLSDFWDYSPSWQNSCESIKRKSEYFIFFAAFTENKPAGYCVFEPATGDVTQIAVDKQYRRKGIATLLFLEAIKFNKNDSVKIINTEVSCNSITGFLKSKDIHVNGKQFEMIKKL